MPTVPVHADPGEDMVRDSWQDTLDLLRMENAADEAEHVTGWAVEVVDPAGETQLLGPYPLPSARRVVARMHRELNVLDPRPVDDLFTFHIRPLYDFTDDDDSGGDVT